MAMSLAMMLLPLVLLNLLVLSGLDSVEAILKNVALGKPTYQKDVYGAWYARRAVDGKFQVVEDHTSCTATATHRNTWWVVDLLRHYHIRLIRIQNRNNAHERLTDFYIYASGSNPIPMLSNDDPLGAGGDLCLHHPGTVPAGAIKELQCNSNSSTLVVSGRYVYVWKPGNSILTLCEFEVWEDVDADSIRTTLSRNIHPKHQSTRVPVYTVVQSYVSPATCYLTCVSIEEGVAIATHFQVNENSGSCQCIQFSEFKFPDLGLSSNEEWDLWEMNVAM